MILPIVAALASAQELVPDCEFNYPIAGSSGFANAQTGRRTNRNTYSAANFAERALIDDSPEFQWALEWNATFNAARVPTLCGDADLATSDKQRLYAEPLDLYASNMAISFETHSVGAFYSASVTQSVMGQRWFAVPSLIIQLYPMVSAPFVGVWQTGDGVASYSLDWIGGAHVDTRWFGARVGYTGIGGGYEAFAVHSYTWAGSLTPDPTPDVVVYTWDFTSSAPDDFSYVDPGETFSLTLTHPGTSDVYEVLDWKGSSVRLRSELAAPPPATYDTPQMFVELTLER